jgi:hypothetical protein
MKRAIAILFSVLLVFVAATTAFAGAGNRTGTNGASELLIPVGARDIALGGATISTTRGVEALFWNPAGVAKMTGSASLYMSHMNYIADIGVEYGAVSANFNEFGVLSLSLKSLSVGDIPVTTTSDPDGTGQVFSPQFFTIGLSYSRQLSDRISVGLTTHILAERLGDVSANGVAFDVGVIYDNLASFEGLSLGVVVKNIGPQMTFSGPGLLTQASVTDQNRPPQLYAIEAAPFELPSTIEFGLGYKKAFDEVNAVLLTTSFQSNNFSGDEYRLGLEYGFQNMLFLRGGYTASQKDQTGGPYLYGPSFGLGVQYALGSVDVSFDYAFRAVKVFDANHVISLKLGF